MNDSKRNRCWDKRKRISILGAEGLFVFLIWLLILIPFLLPGCKTCVPIVEIHDSIRIVEVRQRDTTIITKADSASIHALLRCDSTNNVIMDELFILQGEHLQANTHTQVIPGGGLLIDFDCKEDSLKHIIHLQDSIIREKSNNTIIRTKEVIPKFYKGCTIALWVLVALLELGLAIAIIIKVYFKK